MKRRDYSDLFKLSARKMSVSFFICALVAITAPALLASTSFPTDLIPNTQGQPFEGEWIADFKVRDDRQVEFTLRYEQKKSTSSDSWSINNWSNTKGIAPDQLQGLTREQIMSASGGQVKFQIKYDAGTFDCDGWIKDGRGAGLFTFIPNRGFVSELNRRGIGGNLTDDELFQFARADLGLAFLNELKSQNYETPTLDQLVRMSEHGVRLDFLKGLKTLGAKPKSIDALLAMRENGVSLSYIEQLHNYGFQNLSTEELLSSRQAGVSASFLDVLKREGYGGLSMTELVRLRSQGVSATFIQGLRQEGYPHLSLDQLSKMREQGITVNFIKELKELGYSPLSIEQLIRLRSSGVTPSFIRRVKSSKGTSPTLEELIEMRNRGSFE